MDMGNLTNGFELNVPTTVQEAFCDRTVNAEIGQDFTLPDYQSEMRKLLRVNARILPPSRFLGAGEAEFAGNVLFDVLYVGSDGGLYTTELTAPYTFRISLEGEDGRRAEDRPLCMNIETSTETLVPRLSAPRKLSIKCRLRAHITGLCDTVTDPEQVGEGGIPERLERTRECARTLFATGEAMELTDEFTAPGGEGELRLIETDGQVHITEAEPIEGGVALRGELYLKCMLTRDSVFAETESDVKRPSEIEIVTRRIPFTQTVEMSLSSAGWEATAHGCCTGITARVEDDKILCAATLVPHVQAQGREKVTFVCDCFSTDHATKAQMRRYTYRRPLSNVCGNVTGGGTVSATELGIPRDVTPLDLTATATLTDATAERGRAILSGDACYRMTYRTAEGEFGCAEFYLPLRYEIPGEGKLTDGTAIGADAHATMLAGRARPDGEGYAIDAEWGISAALYTEEQTDAVDEVRFEGDLAPRSGTYTLCYVAPGQTLWQVAKHYHTPLRPLSALNDLPGAADPDAAESLSGVKFLMIE